MVAVTYINAVIDEIKTRLNSNVATLGNFTRISERDEDPAILSTSGDMPIFIVIPLADRADRIKMTMGDGGEVYHDFSISIVGYYLYDNLDDNIRTLRGYGYNCLDLFRGLNSKIATAQVYSATLDIGYFIITDYPIYRTILTLRATMIEP